jgi:hypothetical protein
MQPHNLLQITSSFLSLSFIFFVKYSKKNINENLLGGCLFISIILSQLFWNNPIKGSLVHRLDAYVAKISILYFIAYTLLSKKRSTTYLIVLSSLIFSAYMSNYHSKREWCGELHIAYHACVHVCCVLASLYAFI